MVFRFLMITLFFVPISTAYSQENSCKHFKKLSCPEKWWVIGHPFVAQKALIISLEAREKADSIQQNKLLKGKGDGDQVDAFRHVYWMAKLTQVVGEKKSRKLGVAHEKGNQKDFEKGNKEDGSLPDQVSSEMDLWNNELGLKIGNETRGDLVEIVIGEIKKGRAKIVKTDAAGYFLDSQGNKIDSESLKGKWKNEKCLVGSDWVSPLN